MDFPRPKLDLQRFNAVARVARNSLFVFAARGIDIVMRLIVLAVIARYLGVESFGKFAFVMAFVSFLLPLTDFGIQRILVREISVDKKNVSKFVGSALFLRALLSVALIVAVFVITQILDWERPLVLAIYLATLSEILASFGMIFLGVFRAFERMGYDTLIAFSYQSIRMAFVLIVVTFDVGFLFVFVAMAFAELSKVLIQIIIVSLRFLKGSLGVDLDVCKSLFKEAYPLGIFALMAMATFKVDVFVLKFFRGLVDVSLFEAPHRIIMQLQVVPVSIVTALFPVLSRLATSSRSLLEYGYEKAFKFLLILSLPIAILLNSGADEIILAIFGRGYLEASAAFHFLVWTICFLFPISLMNYTLTSVGKQGLATVGVSACFCVNLILDLMLVPKYGYVGASIATLLAYAVFFCVSFYFTCKNVFPIPLMSLSLKPVVSGFIMMGFCMIYDKTALAPPPIGMVFGCILYVSAILLLRTFSSEDVVLLRGAIKR